MLGQNLSQKLTFGADLFIYLFNRFHHDYNAEIRLGMKYILNKSHEWEKMLRDTKHRDKWGYEYVKIIYENCKIIYCLLL